MGMPEKWSDEETNYFRGTALEEGRSATEHFESIMKEGFFTPTMQIPKASVEAAKDRLEPDVDTEQVAQEMGKTEQVAQSWASSAGTFKWPSSDYRYSTPESKEIPKSAEPPPLPEEMFDVTYGPEPAHGDSGLAPMLGGILGAGGGLPGQIGGALGGAVAGAPGAIAGAQAGKMLGEIKSQEGPEVQSNPPGMSLLSDSPVEQTGMGGDEAIKFLRSLDKNIQSVVNDGIKMREGGGHGGGNRL